MKIYLVRHGIASQPMDEDFEADSQRPLTTRGRDEITRIAGALKKLGLKPDLILSSPYVRAEQTANLLAREFNCQQHLLLSDLLVPDGSPAAILSAIVENYMAEELVIVGHLPCLGLLASLLTAGNLDLAVNIKKGGVCCLSSDDLRTEPRAVLEWLLTPKILLKD